MTAGKQQHVSGNAADTLNHAVRTLADLSWRFASGRAVPEDLPIRMIPEDLGRVQSFKFFNVPFHQISIGFRSAPYPKSSQVRAARCNGLVNTLANFIPFLKTG